MTLSLTVLGRGTPLVLMALLTMLAGCQVEHDQDNKKPNILLLALDDFGYNDLAINNGSDSPTPRLDAIAAQGVRFTRHYAESSCTASRVALLTGRYPARVGAHPYLNGIDHELMTLPDALGSEGYIRHMVGKWHTGDSHRESRPEYQGFDHWFGFINQLYLRGPHRSANYRRGKPTYINPWLENELGDLQQYEGHLTDILTDRALDVIKREQNPWFLYLSYYAPHTPIEPAARFSERYADDPAGRYQAMKDQLDSNIGRIIDWLTESGEIDNTMIIVVSDNGGTAKSWPSNLPFFGSKATYTEGGVRTPLLLSWPGHWPVGQQDDQIAMIFDLYPTILAALGKAQPEGLDGADLFDSDRPPRTLRWYSHGLYGDRYGVLSPDGQWRLNSWQGVTHQLFHESDFVREQPESRTAEHPQKVLQMRESMEQWIRSVTRVNGLTATAAENWTDYTGQAFRRSPMGGTHTLGLAFQRGAEQVASGQRQTLAYQEGYIDISEFAGSLRVLIDGHEAEVELPVNETCFSLVVQSQMVKTNMVFYRKESPSIKVVFVNGKQLEQFRYYNPKISSASPKNPLRITTGSAGWSMSSEMEPFVSTRALSEREIQEQVEPLLRASCHVGVNKPDK